MKRISEKVLSLVLVAAILVSAAGCLTLTSFAYEGDVPVIFIHGQGSTLGTYNEDGSFNRTNVNLDKETIISAISGNTDMILNAFVTQDWTEFCDFCVDLMAAQFEDLVLDENGEDPDHKVADEDYSVGNCSWRYNYGDYGLSTFYFDYDWRLDPSENMDTLSMYIDNVLAATGSDKFALCGRCEGACLALEYLEWYKENHDGAMDSRLTDIVFYSSAALGASPIGEAFSGNLELDADSLERFLYSNDLGLNYEVTDSFTLTDENLRKIITVLSDVYGLDIACWAVDNVYDQIYMNIVPEMLRKCYGSFPGYWAMVEDKYYEEAKEVMFGGQEDTYAKFIEKIDNYHYNVMNRSEELIREAEDSGIVVSDIVKYGFQLFPCNENAYKQSDQVCTVDNASWGATSSDMGETLTNEYVCNAVRNGTAEYISPDLIIDASTGLLPERTWYVKNLSHMDFPASMDPMIFEIINKDLTVFSESEYPQYMFYDYDTDTISPFDAETMTTDLDAYYDDVLTSFFRKIKPAFKWVYKVTVFVLKVLTPKAKS